MGLINFFDRIIHPTDDEDEEEEKTLPEMTEPEQRDNQNHNKVVSIHAATRVQVVLAKPDSFEEVGDLANHLLEKRIVLLSLEATTKMISRRVLDFLSGVAYADGSKVVRVAASTYIITPYNVDILGNLMNELEHSGIYSDYETSDFFSRWKSFEQSLNG